MTRWSMQRPLGMAFVGLLACALLSVYRGQDVNWDLLNYHRYVAYAFLNDRLSVDLAPAGLQSYFNPSLDVPVYWLTERLPGWAVGAIVGGWHGLVFVFTLSIAREVWPAGHAGRPLLAVCAGVLAPVFWGGLGNTMGDNAAAVLALAALWCAIRCIKQWHAGTASRWLWCGATGLLLGTCTALKLTNATVALALGLTMLISLRRVADGAKLAACLVPSGLLGFAVGGGWWFYRVWQQFGNPFFPQFGSLFPSPLANSVSIGDPRFVVESIGGLILRPLLMPLNYKITSEFFVLPLLWPFWFAAGVLWLGRMIWQRARGGLAMGPAWRVEQQLLLLYVLLAFVLWAVVFGIYRYTAAMEPLLPLCMVLLLDRAGCLARMAPWLRRVFVLSIACTLLGGSVNWGHARWAEQTFRPASAMVVRGDKPLVAITGVGNSWLIPFLPAHASYVSVGSNFAFGRRYEAEVQRRAGLADHVYAVVGMSNNWRFEVVDRANNVLARLGALDTETTCRWLGAFISRAKPHAGFARCDGASCPHGCQLTKLDADGIEVDRRDRVALDLARSALAPLGLNLDPGRCTVESAYIGQKGYRFRLCELERTPLGIR